MCVIWNWNVLRQPIASDILISWCHSNACVSNSYSGWPLPGSCIYCTTANYPDRCNSTLLLLLLLLILRSGIQKAFSWFCDFIYMSFQYAQWRCNPNNYLIIVCRTGVPCSDRLVDEQSDDAVRLADSQCWTSAFRRASSSAISVSLDES